MMSRCFPKGGEAVIPEQLAQGLGQVGEIGAIDTQQGSQVRLVPAHEGWI